MAQLRTHTANGFWTDEGKDAVRVRWEDGKSATEIYRELGLRTRNQVISIVHRMGMTHSNQASRPVSEPMSLALYRSDKEAGIVRLPVPRKPPTPHRVTPARVMAPRSPPIPLPVIEPAPPGENPRHWKTRTLMECAFPVGGDGADLISCCDPVIVNKKGELTPYCTAHHARMYDQRPLRKL